MIKYFYINRYIYKIKMKVVPVATGALGTVISKLEKWLQKILRKF